MLGLQVPAYQHVECRGHAPPGLSVNSASGCGTGPSLKSTTYDLESVMRIRAPLVVSEYCSAIRADFTAAAMQDLASLDMN